MRRTVIIKSELLHMYAKWNISKAPKDYLISQCIGQLKSNSKGNLEVSIKEIVMHISHE